MNKKKKILIAVILAVLAIAALYEWYAARGTQDAQPIQAVQTAENGDAPETLAPNANGVALLPLLPEGEETPLPAEETAEDDAEDAPTLDEHGAYTARDDVALYLHLYGRLPENFMTKAEAKALGWSGGGLDDYAYGRCIGGDRFGNYEGNLPEKSGRQYYECDVDTQHKSSRGSKRIVFSNDGLVYYTGDHYETFALLYGEE